MPNIDATAAYDSSELQGAQPELRIIQGSTAGLQAETLELLKTRLRSAAILLAVGFGAFLIQGLLTKRATMFDRPLPTALHALATVITAFVAVRLCAECPKLLQHLRSAEVLVFGVSTLFFASMSYEQVVAAGQLGYVPPVVGPWMFLVFTYALFMPNTWRRSLFVIGPMTILPVAVMLIAKTLNPEVREAMSLPAFQNMVLETAMAMILSAAVAIWGVFSIRSLRREAFEAKRLGQYQLKRLIGSGGMGQVYIAEHRLLKRPCAIKLIKPEAAGDPQALARFEREVRATAKLTHWNTVDIYDYGHSDDGTFYYVMEYLPGLNTADLIQQTGPLSPGRVVYLLRQICEALAEAHGHGIVHRDLKPANIFAAKRGRQYDVAKLLDFGLVRDITSSANVELTAQHTITGSPLFMSPEQALGKPADQRSDIYSLGAVAYTLLTGKALFDSANPVQVILAHANDSPEWPDADVPDDLKAVVMRCLEKDPEHRFQCADDLAEALAECACAVDWSARQAAEWWECNECPHKKQLDAAVMEGELALVE